MKSRSSLFATLGVVALLALSISVTSAQGPIGTAFTYQGRLTDGGGPANGTYDFSFNLYSVPSGGSAIAAPNGKSDVAVSNGLFTVTLDFGANVFNDQARYLDIWVRPGASTGGYTPLAPRQRLTPTPNAIFSSAPWATNGSALSYTGGNVGIGTSGPGAVLSIVKSGSPEPGVQGFPAALKIGSPAGTIPFAFRQNAAENTTPTLAYFETSSGDLGYLSAATNTLILGALTGKNLGLNVNGNNRAMTLATNGNVGIGTTSPLQKLHLSGADSRLRLETTTSTTWTTTEYKADGREWHTGVGGSQVLNDVHNSYYIYDATAGAVRMRINTFGDVAIGTVKPCPDIDPSNNDAKLFVFKGTTPFSCSSAAIFGASETNPGLSGDSKTNTGVSATSRDGNGLHAWSLNSTGIRGESNSGTYIFEGWSVGGIADRRFAVVRASGNVLADGSFSGPADFAEMMTVVGVNTDYAPGDVLVIGPDGKLTRSTEPNAVNLAGVYSAKPGFLGDTEIAEKGIESKDAPPAPDRLAVALIGIVPVRVTDENGPIQPGDLLTTSSTPGHAMKATSVTVNGIEIYPTGTILGKALASWEQGTGAIQVLVTLR